MANKKRNITQEYWVIKNRSNSQFFWSIKNGWVSNCLAATTFDWSSTSEFDLPENGKWFTIGESWEVNHEGID